MYVVFAVINLRGVSTNKTIICFIAMQTYKELSIYVLARCINLGIISKHVTLNTI